MFLRLPQCFEFFQKDGFMKVLENDFKTSTKSGKRPRIKASDIDYILKQGCQMEGQLKLLNQRAKGEILRKTNKQASAV